MLRKLSFMIIGFLYCSSFIAGQESSYPPKWNEFGFWGGYAPFTSQLLGTTSDRQLLDIGLRYGRVIKHCRNGQISIKTKPCNVQIDYILDILPVETMRQPTSTGHEVVYGGGVSPVGFRFDFLPRKRSQLFIAWTAGFVSSVRPIPEDVHGGTQFNYTFDFVNVGFRRFNADGSRAWIFGYKLQHISNAFRTNVNPGVDENVFFAGYSFFR
jgi:Lipid A 3-O-deacylase (PagL)